MASASGVECFSTVASDSPTRVLNLRAIWLREFRTSSLFAATDLLLVQNVSGVAVLRAQAQHILASKACDRAFQNRARLPVRSQTCWASSTSQLRVFRLSHQSQRLLDLAVRNQAEERRLLKLHRQSLAQRVVKHRIAGLIVEIREDNGILVGQPGSRL